MGVRQGQGWIPDTVPTCLVTAVESSDGRRTDECPDVSLCESGRRVPDRGEIVGPKIPETGPRRKDENIYRGEEGSFSPSSPYLLELKGGVEESLV